MSSKPRLQCLLTLTHKYIKKQALKSLLTSSVLELAEDIIAPFNPFNLDMINNNCVNHECFKVYELVDNDTNIKLYFYVSNTFTMAVITKFREFIYKHYRYDLSDYVISANVSSGFDKVIFKGYYLNFSKLNSLIQEFKAYYLKGNESITLEDNTKPKITDVDIANKVKLYHCIEVLPKESITFGKYKHSLVSNVKKCEELQYNDSKQFKVDPLMLINLRNNIVDFKDIITLLETINETCVLTVQQSAFISEIERYYCQEGTLNGFRYTASELADLLLTILAN